MRIAVRAGVKNTPTQIQDTFAITYLRSGGIIFTLARDAWIWQLGHGAALRLDCRCRCLRGTDFNNPSTELLPS